MFPEGILGLNGQIVLHNLDCMQMFVLQKNFVHGMYIRILYLAY